MCDIDNIISSTTLLKYKMNMTMLALSYKNEFSLFLDEKINKEE
jgi:hypothetical protein